MRNLNALFAAIRMRAELNNDSEEEYLDDPIKLFDFEQERVHFGSQPLQCSNTSAYVPHRPEDSVLIENNAELLETLDESDNNIEDVCETDCLPLSVKLVDCGKYPWYYKRYSQQILNKLNIFNLVSDDEDEDDISGDNSDCIIIEDIIDQHNQNVNEYSSKILPEIIDEYNQKVKDYSSKILPEIINKTALEKRHETIKLKEDLEIQIALSLKNTGEIDLKRNKGLVGIKISQKPVTDRDVNTVINNKVKHTKITPRDKSSTNYADICNTKAKVDELVKNLPVKFKLGELSGKLLERIITKKHSVKSRENKHKRNELNKSINNKQKSDPEVNTCKSSSSSNNVISSAQAEETTNTNQVNTKEKLNLELNISDTNEKKKQNNDTLTEKEINLNQNSPKRHEEAKDEPNSPILPCSSTLAKKNRNVSTINFENKKIDSLNLKHVPNKANNNTKLVTNSVIDTLDKSEKTNKPSKRVIPDDLANSVKLKLAANKAARQKPHLVQNTNNVIGQLNENVDTLTKTFINEKCDSNGHVMQNDAQIFDQPDISRIVQSSVERGVTVTFGETMNDNRTTYKCATSNVVATNTCNKTAPLVSHSFKPNLPSQNNSCNEMNFNNIQYNNPCSTNHNTNGTAIVLRPMNPVRAQFNNHMFKQPPRMPIQMQPRFYKNPYKADHQLPPFPPPYDKDHRLNPRSANCGTPNYRFMAPQEIAYPPPQYYQQQFQSVHNGCYQHKKLPQWFQRDSGQHKIYPYLTSVLQSPSNANTGPQSNNISQVKNNINCTNNIGLDKKKYSDPRLLPVRVDSDLVESKTKMLEVLDSATSNLENDSIENDFMEKVQDSANSFKTPKVANKLDPTNTVEHSKQIEQQRPYTYTSLSDILTKLTNETKMSQSASNGLKRGIDEVDPKEKVQERSKFKRPKINTPEHINEDDHSKQIERAGDYSPPILPIPTFQNILHRVKNDVQKQDQPLIKTVSVINVKQIKCNTKKIQNAPQGSSGNLSTRKISLEEYKKRTLQMNEDQFKKSNNGCRNGSDKKNPNLQNKRKYNVDRCSTESDLGYDSDSTVIL